MLPETGRMEPATFPLSSAKPGTFLSPGTGTPTLKLRSGLYRNSNTWLLDASGNGAYGAGDHSYVFGKAGDVFVTGDWV